MLLLAHVIKYNNSRSACMHSLYEQVARMTTIMYLYFILQLECYTLFHWRIVDIFAEPTSRDLKEMIMAVFSEIFLAPLLL